MFVMQSFYKSFSTCLYFLLCCIIACGQDTTYKHRYTIGQSEITLQSVCYMPCRQPITFINLHHNEATSVKAAENFLFDYGGRLVKILNRDERNIAIDYNGQKYLFDPNRMFSVKGIDSSLRLLTMGRSDTGLVKEISTFSTAILEKFIDNRHLIVALHNNTDSNFSVLTYKKEQETGTHSGKVFINAQMDPDDFILTNDTLVFNIFSQKNINAVFENANDIEDDGSLSIYAGKNNIPYVNIEAQHGHTEEQQAMLGAMKDIIKILEKRKKDLDESLPQADTVPEEIKNKTTNS